jgi:beta-glucosidase
VDLPVPAPWAVDGRLEYAEGIHVGHRGWLKAGREPAFCFGHGLGYTTWTYESLEVRGPHELRVRLRNAGERPGREVVQAYLSRPDSSVERPLRWLAGFAGVSAAPGERAEAAIELERRAFRHRTATGWEVEPGEFEVHVGRSVLDLRLHDRVGADLA